MSVDRVYYAWAGDTGQDQEHTETEVKNSVIILTEEEKS